MMIFKAIFAWILILFTILICQAATLSVGPGDSIQAAVAIAKPGDVIVVQSGTYYEHISADKHLTLRGQEMPVLDATASGSAIVLKADGITIEGFRIVNSGRWPESDPTVAGIVVLSESNRIIGNDVSNNFNGLLLLASNNTVMGNRVSRNLGYGIRVERAKNCTIQDNSLEENGQNTFDDSEGSNRWEGNVIQ